jgi:hypothetical protein
MQKANCGGLVLLLCLCGCSSMDRVVVYAQPGQSVKEIVDSLPALGGTIILGTGAWPSGYESGGSVTKPNVTILGAGMPNYNADFTAMSGGTIVLGTLPVSSGADRFKVSDLGVDVGQNYINSTRGGVAADALDIFNQGQVVGAPPVESPSIENVSCLGYSPLAPNHCMLVENVHNAHVHNVQTVMNCHGLVLKGTDSVIDTVFARGHGIDSVIVKSDVYAPASNDHLSNITITPLIAPGDTKGIIVIGVGAPLTGISITGATIQSPLDWGVYVQGAAPSAAVSTLILSNIQVSYPGGSPYGELCMQFVQFVNQITIQNLSCSDMWAGIAPYLPDSESFGNFRLTNSVFQNIGSDAIETWGPWSIMNSEFTSVAGNGIVNPFGVTTVGGNTFSNISGNDTLSTGGSFVQESAPGPQ